MKQQTAIDWLVKEFNLEEFKATIEFAKTKEKEQIINAWCNGYDEDDRATSNPFKYYNEKYGGEK